MLKRKGGYTLVELLVSLGIFGVLIGSLFTILISQNNFFGRASGAMEVGVTARKVMVLLVKELRTAKQEVVTVYDRPLDQAGVIEDHINGRSILFQVPVDFDGDGDFFDENGLIEWGCEGGHEWAIEYYWDNTNNRVMRRLWDTSSTAVSETVIAENISNFLIEGYMYNGAAYERSSSCQLLKITVTAQKTTLLGRTLPTPLTYTLNNQVSWRN
ncbi:MAG: type II secretion system GspH family protein [Candidatus Omnitrophica bacterium]|nr:type II secretion system GspH family protein [Candidatus Omnitrophota bacterium]